MTAVAVIWPEDRLYKGRDRARAHTFWRISWRGPCGRFSADVVYRTRERAEDMARLCGAKEIEYVEARP